MLFNDAEVSGTRITADGYLVADVRVARTGIQMYTGLEVDPTGKLGLRDRASVRVFRPEAEVFSEDSIRSYAYRPVTNDHPMTAVDSKNWRDLSVGQTGGEVVRDGEWVRVPMILMDASMVDAVKNGKRQLSMGYNCVIDATPGVSPAGDAYDAVQTGLRMNHLAVVAAARAGHDARIGDDNPKEDNMSDTMKTVVLGDRAVSVSASDAALVEQFKIDTNAKITAMQTSHDALMSTKSAELAAKDAEIAVLKSKVLDGVALDAAVAARSDLIARATAVDSKVVTAGKSDKEIRRAAVAARVGDAALVGKDDAYVDAYFDILAKDAATTTDSNTQLDTVLTNRRGPVNDASQYQAAVSKSVNDLNAHRKN